MISEFDLIARYFEPLGQNGRGVSLGIGDDCAILDVPAGQQLLVSIDTLVEDVHFLSGTTADMLAYRVAGACLSDLAAMGAEPAWITLALTLPQAEEQWLKKFSGALAEMMNPWDICLVGGDTTRGKQLTISLQVHGWAPKGEALTRNNAKPGDLIYVSGTLGDSAAGLDQLQNKGDNQYLIDRFYRPTPRIETGLAIRPFASAAIDISDGLLADLGHILERSQVGALINPDSLPLSDALAGYPSDQALEWALTGGEDFELCFTVPVSQQAALEAMLKTHPVSCTQIGQITNETGLQLQQTDGSKQTVGKSGYRHF